MAPAVLRAVVAVVVEQELEAVLLLLPVLLPLLRQVAGGRALLLHRAHKLLPLALLQVAEVLAPLPQEAEVAAAADLLLVQGRDASETLRRR